MPPRAQAGGKYGRVSCVCPPQPSDKRTQMLRLLKLAPLALLVPWVAQASVVWKGDFETGDLSQFTEAWFVAPDRMQVEGDLVRDGNKALKVTVQQGDNPVNASGNRNELFRGTYEPEGSEYYYKWSTLFPQDFPSSPRWQVFTQWHHDGCCGSPPLEFFVINDTMNMRVGGSSGEVLWQEPLHRDQWNDFVMHVKWSPDPNVGFVELYYNGNLVVPMRNIATRYPDTAGYIQLGYYRDASIAQTASLYHDGFTMATTLEEVMPPAALAAPAP
ncbi:carbohydrate-binding protein [Corallococcus carmarthensis]|uniref:Carbohydrate-binding protein n=2 Tax=Corallococcus carmarthensis TaxID=2316728 RepID=A0A3A8JUQ9_9BACT|nr:carbohydrate-binding protein [Corallococcus carmarthensis]